eukprot:evm.model.scf_1803.1 EVM.evm.TU.scf_1803.1   scf_1803:28743-33230(+)
MAASNPGGERVSRAELAVRSGTCVICLSDAAPGDAARVGGCRHEFCVGCLRKWASGRRNPLCPLCAAPIHAIVLPNGEVEPVVPEEAKAEEEEPDLGCLDHAYFLAETQRLLSRAKAAQDAFYREAFGGGRRGSERAEDAVATLGGIVGSLLNHRQHLELELPFDPNSLLQELYNLDSIVHSVQAGTWESTNVSENPPPRRYGADDADSIHLNEGDVDIDEEELDRYIATHERCQAQTRRAPAHRGRHRKKQGLAAPRP